MMRFFGILFPIILLLGLAACQPDGESSGAQKETQATKQLMNQASALVGVPGIKNFTEKRQLKMLYELRDQAGIVTYSYYVDFNGGLHNVCADTSIGFGMPFSAQFTAPEVTHREYDTTQTTQQPEPNGLYMPDSTSATWVICMGENGEPEPTYVEPQILVSLSPRL